MTRLAISGRDKGRRGEVLKVLDDGRLLVSNVNLVKKHKKANLTLVNRVE